MNSDDIIWRGGNVSPAINHAILVLMQTAIQIRQFFWT